MAVQIANSGGLRVAGDWWLKRGGGLDCGEWIRSESKIGGDCVDGQVTAPFSINTYAADCLA